MGAKLAVVEKTQPLIIPIDVAIEDTRFCAKCEQDERFVIEWECFAGRIGTCVACGRVSLSPFTRIPSQAA